MKWMILTWLMQIHIWCQCHSWGHSIKGTQPSRARCYLFGSCGPLRVFKKNSSACQVQPPATERTSGDAELRLGSCSWESFRGWANWGQLLAAERASSSTWAEAGYPALKELLVVPKLGGVWSQGVIRVGWWCSLGYLYYS